MDKGADVGKTQLIKEKHFLLSSLQVLYLIRFFWSEHLRITLCVVTYHLIFSFSVFLHIFPRLLCILIDRFSPVFSSDCLLLSARGWKYSSRLPSFVGERSFTFYFSNVLGLSHEFLLKKHLVLSTKHQRQQTLSNKKKNCSINSQKMESELQFGGRRRNFE